MINLIKSLFRALGGIVGVTLLYLGRRVLSANYFRGIQYLEDWHIRLVGGGIVGFVIAFGLNYWFMMMLWTGMQIGLLICIIIVAIYYLTSPAIAVPLAALGTGVLASEPGDQPNLPMIVGALKSVLKHFGVVMTWMAIYVSATIIIPLYLSPAAFWLATLVLIVLIGLLVGGKIEVSKAYKILERGGLVTLVLIAAFLFIFQENVSSWTTMAHTKQKYAEIMKDGKERKDVYIAKKLEGVYINPQGQPVKIENGKAVDASKELEAVERALHEEGIVGRAESMIQGTGKEAGAHAGKSGRPSYLSIDYWVAKSVEWGNALGVPVWTVMTIVVLLIGFHFWLLTKFIVWAWKKSFDKNTAVVTVTATAGATSAKKNPFPIIGVDTGGVLWLLFWVIILALLAYGVMQWMNGPAGKDLAYRWNGRPIPITEAYTIRQPKDWGAILISPNQHLPREVWREYAGKDNWNNTKWVDIPQGLSEHPLRVEGTITAGDSEIPGAINMTVLRKEDVRSTDIVLTGNCVDNAERMQTCTGSWESSQLQPYGVGKGTFLLNWERNSLQAIARLEAKGIRVMEIKFRPRSHS